MKLCPRCSEPFAEDAGFCPYDGSQLVRSADPLVGRTLAARYRLLKRIGSGGMAAVYLARHVMIDRRSAIKLLRPDLVMSPAHRERFLREARAVNRINHPNIVEITDCGEDAGLSYLVMEFVEGKSLHDALQTGRFAWPRGLRAAIQLASALSRAHEMGVVHRDLKPENVFLTTRGGEEFVKLGDFGIAKILDAPALTFGGERFGTAGYIPPEVIEGAQSTPSGDLYSLGVVLYNMVTGVMPFDARGAEVLVAALREAPVKPSARVADLPAELEALVLSLLARRPEDRPRDAFAVHDAMVDLLRRHTHGAKASSQPPPVEEEDQDLTSPVTIGDPSAARPALTAQLGALPTAEIAARWHGMLTELGSQIDAARKRHGEAPKVRRARSLAEDAQALIASLERAKSAAAEHQARVDRLEAQGRTFRAMLGGAIDTLSRDRSRERAHLEAIASRRRRIDEDSTQSAVDRQSEDSLVWERAALEAEDKRSRAVEADLTHQIDELQGRLAHQNEQLDADMRQASGELEGALAALRRMTGELVKAIEEAAAAVGR